MIVLSDTLIVGKGGSRYVYAHPQDLTKVIKIEHDEAENVKPNNEIDFVYFNYLLKKKKDLSHIPFCYGWIETTLGKGLMFDFICNVDNTFASSFDEAILSKEITKEESKHLLSELIEYLRKNKILFVDVALSNLIVQHIDEDRKKLVIIDGLGSRRFKFKFWLYRQFEFLAYYKVLKQTKKLFSVYEEFMKDLK